MVANRCKSGDWDGRLRYDLHHRLRSPSVGNLANLAMLLVVCVRMPMRDRVEAQGAHSEDERNGEQTQDYSFHHTPIAPSKVILSLMLPACQSFYFRCPFR